jgi:polar amino acid transport system substrate-binding protein
MAKALFRTMAAIAFGGGLLFAPGLANAQSACTQLTFTGHPDYAPLSYRDGDAIAGAGAALVEEVAANLGITAVSEYAGPWEDAQMAARNGDVDIIFNLYYNEDRATYLDFVEPPFALNPEVAIAAAGATFAFTGRDDLIGKRGVTVAGESFGIDFDAFLAENLQVARVERLSDAFSQLLNGEADYLLFGQYPALAEAARLGISDQIQVLSPNLVEGDLYVAFSKQSPCLSLMDAFGAEIQAMLDNGRVGELIDEATRAWNAAVAP